MGKKTGFLDYARETSYEVPPTERIKNFDEFHIPLSTKEQQKQGARCMDCGIPFCQYGQKIKGMFSGCPLNNLIPEWNDLVFKGKYEQAHKRLKKTNNFPEFTSRVCPALCEKACTCSLDGDAVSVKENDLVFKGKYEQAHKRLKKTNNFPEFTSRVCPALCEKACTCSLDGDAVSVKENEHAIIEYAYEHLLEEPKPPIKRVGKKIAVIGSGPAGLAAADTLNQRGYNCDVYEREDRLGGLLMYGIPNMKIEKNIIDRRIYKMTAEGVKFFTNKDITTKKQAKELLSKYDAVILAVGAKEPRDINVPGREGNNILFAVDYLTQVTKSLLNSEFKDGQDPNAKGKNVLVIGGGDTGNDCVGTAIRHGAKSVLQLEMMSEPPLVRADSNPWPEWPLVKKTDYGQEENIAVFGEDPRVYNSTVKEFILDSKGNVKQAVIVKLQTVVKDGRRSFEQVPGSEKTVPCDLVLIAAGFIGAQKPVINAFGVELDARNTVKCDENDHHTNISKLYSAGDVRRGQSLVVWAIREGRDVAKQVDFDLMGYTGL